ncbi:DUF2637 domain-containing protein [Kitasatospora sp. NPDC048365]|uniref:DUF2637 domain-containing protein n=1 Tax=Kitasatospora sp. NPDC048365 TaxID=3364050 RepID=UPI003719AECA
MARPSLSRAHRALLGVVAAGACLISGIGFAGSYSAVRDLAMEKGFGAFSYAFPIGVDAGIVVLLSLDLVLTWLRIPFPLLRQTAWLLTAATIAFNAAASWGDALGMAMHAVIPVLFVVVVEASRHAVGRMAAITADRYMESVRLMRWLLSPVPTFRLWRRMKLWELRSYDETVRLEQNRLVYRAQLRFRYGRGWRRSAPFQALLPLKLAKYGVPLDPSILDRIDGPLALGEQAGAVAAAGELESGGNPAVPSVSAAVAVPTLAKLAAVRRRDAEDSQTAEQPPAASQAAQPAANELNVWTARAVRVHAEQQPAEGGHSGRAAGQASPWFKPPRVAQPGQPGQPQAPQPTQQQVPGQRPSGQQAQQAQQGQAGRPAQQSRPMSPAAQAAQAAWRNHAGQNGQNGQNGQGGHEGQGEQDGFARAVPFHESQGGFPEGPAGQEAEPMRIGPRPIRLEMAVSEPLPFDEAEAAELGAGSVDVDEEWAGQVGRRGQAEPLDTDVCFEALTAYLDSYANQPDQQQFADFLTREWGLAGSRSDGAVSAADVDKIWTKLQNRFVESGRE